MPLCLIIDDDELSVEISERTLKALNLETVSKTDSIAALLFCTDIMPDLILLDMKMPGLDGFGFIKILHKMRNGRKPQIIACTGLSDIQTVQKLREIGVAGYLVKPYNEDLLIEKVVKLSL